MPSVACLVSRRLVLPLSACLLLPLSALLASVAGLDSALPALPTLSVRQLRPFQSRPWTYSSGTARVACFVSRFEKMAKILDRDIPLSVRGYVF